MRAALRLLETMTLRPLEVNAQLIEAARDAGLHDDAMRAVGAIAFHFNLMNRFADAFDFDVPDAAQRARSARLLNFAARHTGKAKDNCPWMRGEDGRVRPTEVERARQVLLSAPGLTSPELRQAMAAFVRRQWGLPAADMAAPAELERYLTKLALHAYRIVDEDIEALRDNGYADRAIYEITVVGAVSAAVVGVEQLFGALHGSDARQPSEAA